jgi:NADH-quinone oxidoreductase subunit J
MPVVDPTATPSIALYQVILPSVLGALAVWWMMPGSSIRPRIVGALIGIAGLVVLAGSFTPHDDAPVQQLMTGLFGVSALAAAVLMITNHNPVYAALWFAVVTLSVCGLFLMQSAPFLAAATIIVYAGAIIVTFLFVIMLAQQSGASIYDTRARQPFLASVAAFVLFGGILFAMSKAAVRPAIENAAVGSMRGLGSELFGRYLYSVEIAGTLLLIATIGAIAIAPRRSKGTL